MSGFFKEEEIKNPDAGKVWDKKERDKALNEYFSTGGHPKRIGIKYKGSPKAFQNSILNKLKYNFEKKGQEEGRGRAEKYKPSKYREWRGGKKFTPNEIDFIRCHKEQGISPEVTAKILCRKVSEIHKDYRGESRRKEMQDYATSLDLILAYRYAHHATGYPTLISDETYDEMVEDELEFGGVTLKDIQVTSYPSHIKSLAIYLAQKHELDKLKKK